MSVGDQRDVIDAEGARASFEEFVGGSSARLFTMALLLTDRQRADAEDLLQGVLERAYRHWRRRVFIALPEKPQLTVRDRVLAPTGALRLLRLSVFLL